MITLDRYLPHAELVAELEALRDRWPTLVALETIGHSHEGRPILVAIVTATATATHASATHASATQASATHPTGRARTHRDKPAIWVDGNIHATELAPSAACLALVHALCRGWQTDPQVTRALETRTFYVCPRVNPDGAELALAESPRYLRSSTRHWPTDAPPSPGLRVEDVDGDGRILSMRVPDPDGAWKVSEHDPRLMVRRAPAEWGGRYYRVLPEGRVEAPEQPLQRKPVAEGLDLNRNFPAAWKVDAEQPGAGPFPASEPEVRAIVEFVVDHPNITAGIAFHTMGGLLLRPYSHRPDDDFPPEDLAAFEQIGAAGERLTGYPAVSVYHGFRDRSGKLITGALDDWLFEHLGIFGWTVEIWNPMRAAGIELAGPDVIQWHREHPEADDLALLRWNDETLGGTGFVEWTPFEHPELGPVEIGGWHDIYTFRNPPPALLEQEVARFPEWLVWHALISPELAWVDCTATAEGDGLVRVRAEVRNVGWLPTSVSVSAATRQLVAGVRFELELPAGAALAAGSPPAAVDLGHLEGRSQLPSTPRWGHMDPTADRARIDWWVRVDDPELVASIVVTARAPRAGRIDANPTFYDDGASDA